jgi:ribosomal protein S27AE
MGQARAWAGGRAAAKHRWTYATVEAAKYFAGANPWKGRLIHDMRRSAGAGVLTGSSRTQKVLFCPLSGSSMFMSTHQSHRFDSRKRCGYWGLCEGEVRMENVEWNSC